MALRAGRRRRHRAPARRAARHAGHAARGAVAYGETLSSDAEAARQVRAASRRRRWASCSSGWCAPGTAAAKRCRLLRHPRSAARCSRSACCVDAARRAGRTCCWRSAARRSATCCRAWSLARHGQEARQHRIRLSLPDALDLLVVSVEAASASTRRMQRVGEELAFAHPELSDELRLDQPRAARRQGARRGAAQPGRAHRRRRPVVAGRDAGADRQVRHQRGAVAARALRDAAHQAPAARRRGRGQDRREDGVPAGLLHLPGDLGRDASARRRSSSSRSSFPMANK